MSKQAKSRSVQGNYTSRGTSEADQTDRIQRPARPSNRIAAQPSSVDQPRRGLNILLLSGASVARIASSVMAGLAATLVLGATQRGVMVLGTTIGTVVALVAGLGTNMAFRLRLPALVDPTSRRRLISAYTWWSLLAAGSAGAIATVASALSALLIDPALSDGGFLAAVGAFTAAQVLLTQTTDAWFADGRFRQGSISAALITAGGLAGLLCAIALSGTAATLLSGQSAGMLLAWALLCGRVRSAGLMSLAAPAFRQIRPLVATGFPTLGLAVGLAIAVRGDRYVLGAMVDTATVGVYSLAASLAELARIAPQAMGQLFMHDMTMGTGLDRMRRWFTLSVVAAAVTNVLVVLAGWFLIVPVFGAEFETARSLLLILAVAEVCFAPYAVASLGLLGGGWTKTAGALGIGGATGSVGCYLITASVAGAWGVAAGSVLVYAGLSLTSSLLLRHRLRQRANRTSGVDLRRVFDVVLASVGLIVSSPVMFCVAVLTRWRLGSPVLFRQQRLGLHGDEFTMLKFRTMPPAEYPSQPDTERMTRFGSIIRSLSLDELPQLVNILRGEMSLIGPRPGLPGHLQRYCARQLGRLVVRPGITGWAQVHGRNSVSLPERIELDLWYIEHRSWLVDLRIIGATIAYLLWPRNVVGAGGVNPDFPPELQPKED